MTDTSPDRDRQRGAEVYYPRVGDRFVYKWAHGQPFESEHILTANRVTDDSFRDDNMVWINREFWEAEMVALDADAALAAAQICACRCHRSPIHTRGAVMDVCGWGVPNCCQHAGRALPQ